MDKITIIENILQHRVPAGEVNIYIYLLTHLLEGPRNFVSINLVNP